jgi:hypothetical protein
MAAFLQPDEKPQKIKESKPRAIKTTSATKHVIAKRNGE